MFAFDLNVLGLALLVDHAVAGLPALPAEAGRLCRFAADLKAPGLAFLWDHVVAGRSILPGAGMMEFTSVQGRMLATEGSHVCLLGASIPAPIVLSGASVSPVEGSLDCASGAVELQTLSAGGISQG